MRYSQGSRSSFGRQALAIGALAFIYVGSGTERSLRALDAGRALGAQTTANTQGTAPEDFGKGAYQADTPNLKVPVGKQTPDPQYTAAAMRARVEGDVAVEIVVKPDGTVGETRLSNTKAKNPLHSQRGEDTDIAAVVQALDTQALKAVKQWTFEPGRLDDKPVSVILTENLAFRLGPCHGPGCEAR